MQWWRSGRIRGVLIGGLAIALVGRPRVTRDIDALVLLDDSRWKDFLKSGRAFGISPRQPDALDFARENRVLLLRHRPSEIDIDISLGSLPFEVEAVSRAKRVRVAGVTVPLATPEDLIVMKAIAHRDRDLIDIQGLLDVHPKLDWERVRRWVSEFAAVLETPDIIDDLERLISNRRKRKRDGQ